MAVLRFCDAIEAHKTDEKVSKVIMVGTPIKFCGRSEIHEFLPPLDSKKPRRRVRQFIHIVSLDWSVCSLSPRDWISEKIRRKTFIKYKEKKRHFQKQKNFTGIMKFSATFIFSLWKLPKLWKNRAQKLGKWIKFWKSWNALNYGNLQTICIRLGAFFERIFSWHIARTWLYNRRCVSSFTGWFYYDENIGTNSFL